jgi:AcrR family transcriptional regulator
MTDEMDTGLGKRQQNRIATRQRIADAALRLFESRGYDATTLEEVARVSGISARTLFHYFKTKDELVDVFRAGAFDDALADGLRAQPREKPPFRALKDCLAELVERFDSADAVRIDRLLNSTETLRARKQQIFAAWERVASDALRDAYAPSQSGIELANTAMAGIGALRLALVRRREDIDPKPLLTYLREQFANMGVLAD